jgi:hypothetical protein
MTPLELEIRTRFHSATPVRLDKALSQSTLAPQCIDGAMRVVRGSSR